MGSVRITSGRLRGRKVTTPEGQETRPLLTRVRKSLVDLLRPRLPGARVLELFGGSGAIALELLSNGAARATVVELNPRTARLIGENAAAVGEGERVRVQTGDALAAAEAFARAGERFDLVVVAPPYGRSLHQEAVAVLDRHPLLAPGGLVVVQRDTAEPEARAGKGLVHVRSRSYGKTTFDFYEAAAR